MTTRPTLRTPAELLAAGLVAPDLLREIEAVAERYAVAISPAMAQLIDLADPDIDWQEVAELVDASYRLVAPKKLVAELDAR